MTAIIIIGILLILVIGFIQLFRRNNKVIVNLNFANEYRNNFIDFANNYFSERHGNKSSSNFDNDRYIWLTKNVNKIQNDVGGLGVMSYKPAFENYIINEYYIIINAIPKFRDGQIENFDVTSVDDCLLRYIGNMEERNKRIETDIKNPIIWFREGIQEVLSIPLYILGWFGIFSSKRIYKIIGSSIYKVFSGFIALVTLLSGLVTIIQGKEKTLEIISRLLNN